MTFYYPVVLYRDGARYRAAFYDLHGCYGEGADAEDALDDARAEGVSCILSELESGASLPPHTAPEEIPLSGDARVVMLALVLPREENWSWLG